MTPADTIQKIQKAILETLTPNQPFTSYELADKLETPLESIQLSLRYLVAAGILKFNRLNYVLEAQ